MKGRKTWERGYAAGLMDGEGCIQIKKLNQEHRSRNTEYSLQISMNLVDGESIDFMYGVFGGSVYFINSYDKENNRLDNYRWEITREPAKYFLKQILPFLKIKKQQAELGIRFQEIRKKEERQNGRYRPISQDKLDRYEIFYQKMRELKTIHTPSAAVTTKRVEPIISVSDSLVLQEQITVS